VAGWADGLLVRFEIGGGRMRTWIQRSCSQAEARRHVAATPPEWAEFAGRNAELAARLRRSRRPARSRDLTKPRAASFCV
jgi:excinuclease ABC subunit C